jgi:hypothetical protein
MCKSPLCYHCTNNSISYFRNNNFNQKNLHFIRHSKYVFIVNYLVLYALLKFGCEIRDDGDSTGTPTP